MKLWWIGTHKRKKRESLYLLFCLKGFFLKFVLLSQCIVYWIHFLNLHTFTCQKTLLHTLLLLVSKTTESLQRIPNAGIPKGSILGPTLFLPYINGLPDDANCDIATYANDATLPTQCDQALDMWQQLELPSEIDGSVLVENHLLRSWVCLSLLY